MVFPGFAFLVASMFACAFAVGNMGMIDEIFFENKLFFS